MSELKIELLLVLFFLTGLIGFLLNLPLIFYTAAASFLFILLARIWNKYVFHRLNIRRSVSRKRIAIGDKITYQLEIENKKLLPVPGLRIEDKVTGGVEFINNNFFKEVTGTNFNIFHDIFNLRWYERVRRSYEIKVKKRGYYQLGRGRIFYKGLFGLFSNFYEDEKYQDLIVYPRILPANELGLSLQQLFGSKPRQGWLYPDRLNKVGVRPYQTTDDSKRINWKASARHGNLESNIYRPSRDQEYHIFLQSGFSQNWWQGLNQKIMELMVIYAASIANFGLAKGYAVGLYSNGLLKKSRKHLAIKPEGGQAQKKKILTGLALLQSVSLIDLGKVMEKEKGNVKNNSTVIVINYGMENNLKIALNKYRKKRKVHIVSFSPEINATEMPGIELHQVRGRKDWDEIQNMELF
ncbi:MAG: DUF58 domain-containing protein [Halanaerobiales bacterium]